MKFGKSRQSTRKNRTLIIPINKNGIGEESIESNQKQEYDDIIFSEIYNTEQQEPEKTAEKDNTLKLYLNRIINLLNNKKRKRTPIWHKFLQRFVKVWRNEKSDDLKDLISFVVIHGVLGAPALISLLTITNVDIELIRFIKSIKWLTTIVYIVGSGSFYYLFLDLNLALKDTWRIKKK